MTEQGKAFLMGYAYQEITIVKFDESKRMMFFQSQKS